MSDTPEPKPEDETPSPAPEPVEAVVEAPVEKPTKRVRVAAKTQPPAPVMVTVRNPSRRLVVLQDNAGNGIYLLPSGSQEIAEERVSASIMHQASLGLIVLS